MAAYRTCLIAYGQAYIQQMFIEFLLYTILNTMHVINQVDFMIAPVLRQVHLFMVLPLHVAIFLSELFSIESSLSLPFPLRMQC